MIKLNYLEDEDYNFLQFCLNYNGLDFSKNNYNKEKFFLDNCGVESLKLIKDRRKNQYFYKDNISGSMSLSSVKSKTEDKLYQKTFRKIAHTENYIKFLNERNEYSKKVKKIWRKHYNKIDKYLKRVLKNDYQETNINLYIANPYCNTGRTIHNDNFIVFGHEKGIMQNDPNYELVYIVHESMHLLYPYEKFCNNTSKNYPYDIVHLIIELVTDHGIAIELGGKSYKGHDFLEEYKEFLLPKFNEYLKDEEYKSLSEFIRQMICEYETFSKM